MNSFARSTRSGKTFADWDGPQIISDAGFDFAAALREQLDRFEIDEPGDDLLPAEKSMPVHEPVASGSQTSVAPGSSLVQPSNELSSQERRAAKKKAQGHQNRATKRQAAKPEYANPPSRPKAEARFKEQAQPVFTTSSASGARVAQTAYVTLDDGERSSDTFTLEELVGENSRFKFTLHLWDGKLPLPIVDREGRIIAVMAGQPDLPKPQWEELQASAAALFEDARQQCYATIQEREVDHRRGAFATLCCGFSHGGGQKQPQNVRLNQVDAEILETLNSSEPLRRISGFASSIFEAWAPNLHAYYVEKLGALQDHDKKLHRPFSNSVFPMATYNLGPRTVCYRHLDFANLPFGWCAITALGSFDYKKGGHLVLWECGLVIEFPPGSTALIPSSIVHHSNTALPAGQDRYSFTQYAAGGLFRWVDHGFKKVEKRRGELKPPALAALDAEHSKIWAFGLSLFSKLPWASAR